jgi:hypothetical protein
VSSTGPSSRPSERRRHGGCEGISRPAFRSSLFRRVSCRVASLEFSDTLFGCGGGERGAPGSGQHGADEGEDAASRRGRVAQEDVRLRRVRLREVWRQAAGAGVREGRGWSASDSGAPGPGHGRCEAGPGARAPTNPVVLRLESPQPREPGPCRAPLGRAAWAGVFPKGLRGFSTRLAHCSGGPRLRALLGPCSPALTLHRPSIRPMRQVLGKT